MTSLNSSKDSSAMSGISPMSTAPEQWIYLALDRPSSTTSAPKPADKGNLMIDGCADTSIAVIGKGFVEVYTTECKVTLVGFHSDSSKTEVTIGGAAAAIDLPNGTIIIQVNEAALIKADEGVPSSLLSTCQAREYGTW